MTNDFIEYRELDFVIRVPREFNRNKDVSFQSLFIYLERTFGDLIQRMSPNEKSKIWNYYKKYL